MLVTEQNLTDVLADLAKQKVIACDTETTGLSPYHKGHRIFSVILAHATESYYFNFLAYPEHPGLPREATFRRLQAELFDVERLWVLFNAKFDMHMLAMDGMALRGRIHCCAAYERLVYNKHMEYSLDAIAPCYGLQKSREVDEYIAKHKLYTSYQQEGKKKKGQDKHFDRVPFPIISRYGETDGRVTYDLAARQRERLYALTLSLGRVDEGALLVANERELTQVCFNIERRGIHIDRTYCAQAFAYTSGRASGAANVFKRLTGATFVDSPKVLAPILERAGVPAGRTAPSAKFPDGQISYAKAVLAKAKHPVAEAILEYRRFSKVAYTYFRNFLDLADSEDLIHGNLRQAGTDTARFSMSDPNLQNLKKNDEDEDASADEDALDAETSYNVRRVFTPPPDFCFVMIDYDQQEYRMMLDLAGELELIDKVKAGLDVHKATAEMMGETRSRAKTLNFLLLYGGGVAKLAEALGITLDQAKALRGRYFERLPKVVGFIRDTIEEADRAGRIFNWAGRMYHFDRETSYKAPNTKIQGGGADVMRFAMVQIERFLAPYRSKQIATVHDEILFQVHKSELHLVPELQRIMENVYPHKHLPLTCSVSHSWQSWADKVKGYPT